jgi:ABC-type sugar transport system ATPase subunit
MASVELRDITKSFGTVSVIEKIDLTIAKGEFVCFVGPSGSGKSTLLRMIAGLETVSGGDVLIDGNEVTFAEPSERGIAMVFQSYALYPQMTVYDNIAFNLRLSKFSKDEIDKRVKEAARILRLNDLLARSPAQLSGGQRQRVAIGRAIVRNPKVFLFDEPLSNLDAAMTLADRIVALDAGVIQQVGPPLELYARPANLFVAGFIGSPKMNFLAARVDAVSSGVATLVLAANPATRLALPVPGAAVGDAVSIGVRPEAIEIIEAGQAVSPDLTILPATVESVDVTLQQGYLSLIEGDPGFTARLRQDADGAVRRLALEMLDGRERRLRSAPQ